MRTNYLTYIRYVGSDWFDEVINKTEVEGKMVEWKVK